MTPPRAWKPPNTGNTCSMVSAMVASCRRDRKKGRYEAKTRVWGGSRGGYWLFFTCVSLKSFTPTQYTVAPRDRASSAWRNKGAEPSLLPKTVRTSWRRTSYLLLRLDEVVLQKLSVCQSDDHAGCAWKKQNHNELLLPLFPEKRFNYGGFLPKFSFLICSFAFKWQNTGSFVSIRLNIQAGKPEEQHLRFETQGPWRCPLQASPSSKRSDPSWSSLWGEMNVFLGRQRAFRCSDLPC